MCSTVSRLLKEDVSSRAGLCFNRIQYRKHETDTARIFMNSVNEYFYVLFMPYILVLKLGLHCIDVLSLQVIPAH